LTNEAIIKTKKFIKKANKTISRAFSKRSRYQNEESIIRGGKQTKSRTHAKRNKHQNEKRNHHQKKRKSKKVKTID
jgi:hypothetical protein